MLRFSQLIHLFIFMVLQKVFYILYFLFLLVPLEAKIDIKALKIILKALN